MHTVFQKKLAVKKCQTLKEGRVGPNLAPAGCEHDLNRSYRELMNIVSHVTYSFSCKSELGAFDV